MREKQLSLAVHLHLYYLDMWPEIKGYLANIGDYPYDLFVTLVAENPQLEEEIRQFKPDAKIWVVENRGYDVGPFIDFLHHIDLDKYDLILKLHTKNGNKGPDTKLNGLPVSRELWKKLLIESLLETPEQFKKNVEMFKKNPDLGMIGSRHLITSKDTVLASLKARINETMLALGFNEPKPITFIAGTMFMSRANLLSPIKNNYKLADFDLTDGHVKDGTLAHVMERLFGCVIQAQGYKIKGCGLFSIELILRRIYHFVYANKVTNSGYHVIKIMKLPIFRRKLSSGKCDA